MTRVMASEAWANHHRFSELIYEGDECMKNIESGRIGYVVLWLLGAPAGLLFILWLFLGNNLIGHG